MHIHMIAVGGTGMGALAGLLKAQGHRVTGCDTALYPPMSDAIERYGIELLQGFSPDHLDPRPDVVIIGNAVHAGNPEAKAAIDEGMDYLSMAEAIRRFALDGRKSLVVAGTHGKTTTTALCGYLLRETGFHPNLLVGGILRELDVSFLWGGGEWTVLEGDEYETSFFDKGPKFLHYCPDLLVLNNIEMDHLDNFKDLAALENAFVRLFGVVKGGGLVLAGTESASVKKILPMAGRKALSFGITGGEDWCGSGFSYFQGGTRFHLLRRGKDQGLFQSPLFGAHNLRDTVAALAACLEAGADVEGLKAALARFPGVKRRQEVVYSDGGVTVVDDFAHHPTAIAETLKGLKQRSPDSRVVACFEPRSFTCQTRLHQNTLPAAFSLADVVLLGPVHYSPKVQPEDRLDLERLRDDLETRGVRAWVVNSPEECLEWLRKCLEPRDLVVFLSSGNFYSLPARLADQLRNRDFET